MELTASGARSRGPVVRLRVLGFIFLALGVLGSIAVVVVAFVTIINALSFQTIHVPGTGILSLQKRHYVIYYEDTIGPPDALAVSELRVALAPESEPRHVLSLSPYEGSLTYNIGSRHGRAVSTFNAPHAGHYEIAAASPYAGGNARIAVGPSILGVIGRYLLVGIAGGVVLFFLVGGIGAGILTLSDRKEDALKSAKETTSPFG